MLPQHSLHSGQWLSEDSFISTRRTHEKALPVRCVILRRWRLLRVYKVETIVFLEQIENFDWETPWPCMFITYLKASKLECCLAAIICFFRVGSENAVQLASRYLERETDVQNHATLKGDTGVERVSVWFHG